MTDRTLLEVGLAIGRHANLLWLLFALGALLVLAGLTRIGLHRLDQLLAAENKGCCGPCSVANAGTNRDDEPDDLLDLHDAVFDGDDVLRPVNESRSSRWCGLDVTAPNGGAWLDRVSREKIQNLGPWISDEQQKQAGKRLVAEAEAILKFEQAIRDRGETTGEIRRGDPGE